MNIRETLGWAKTQFEEFCLDNPEGNAEILLEYVLGKKRSELYLLDEEISKGSLKLFKIYVKKRCMNMPVAYITGETEFMSLTFSVNEKVFIPRPETEILVEIALEKLQEGGNVIDMGTGCGSIAVAVAKHSSCQVCACDISGEAIEIARRNAMQNGVPGLISFLKGDMFAPLSMNRKFDLVLSNPPYIRHGEIQSLPEEVRNFEPHIAIDGGEDGLEFYSYLSRDAKFFLKRGGYAIVEVGFDQAEPVYRIFTKHFKSVDIVRDYAGIKRILIAQKR